MEWILGVQALQSALFLMRDWLRFAPHYHVDAGLVLQILRVFDGLCNLHRILVRLHRVQILWNLVWTSSSLVNNGIGT